MSDYIERELALRIIIQKQKELCPLGTYGKKYVDGYNREKFDEWQEIIDGIESVPAADVAEMKHGKWRWKSTIESGEDCYICFCSCCGKECGNYYDDEDDMIYYIRQNYCPHCGAKMGAEG